jgi:predicted HD phosphohydrolase
MVEGYADLRSTVATMSDEEDRPRATFSTFEQGTPDDWAIIGAEFVRYAAELPERVLAHLALLANGHGGFPVDRLTHSLQCATLAHADGRDDEYVVCALLHDVGDSLGAYNHPDVAAAILRPFVSEPNLWMVEKHGLFQSYDMVRATSGRDVLEPLRGHRYFARTEEFCARYDSPAFDPRRPTRPLAFFEPMVHRLFAGPRRAP